MSNFINFSFPFVDAIKVTSYIDINMSSDLVLERVRQLSNLWNR